MNFGQLKKCQVSRNELIEPTKLSKKTLLSFTRQADVSEILQKEFIKSNFGLDNTGIKRRKMINKFFSLLEARVSLKESGNELG